MSLQMRERELVAVCGMLGTPGRTWHARSHLETTAAHLLMLFRPKIVAWVSRTRLDLGGVRLT